MPESLPAATEHIGAAGEPVPAAYYVRLAGNRFHSTLHSQGAWNAHEQHMAPASGLLIHEVLRRHPRPEMVISQATFEILGLIHGGEFEVRTEGVRPGRTIELIEATLSGNGRPAVRALIWRLLTADTADVAGTDGGLLRPPADCPPYLMARDWEGGFVRSVEFRTAYDGGPGRRAAWLRSAPALVEGEDSPPLARYVGVV
ncbi:thioesterase family protein, partial [Arthrobacter deserti]|nr:thioesterase family protein [Arthrobacter deserti]